MVVVCRRKEWVGIHIDGTGERFPFKSLALVSSLSKKTLHLLSQGEEKSGQKKSVHGLGSLGKRFVKVTNNGFWNSSLVPSYTVDHI